MKKKIFRFLVILILTTGGFFIFSQNSFATNNDIVINEIGAYEPTDHEWIEIFNKGSETVDLTGWKFYEDGTNHALNSFRGDLIIEPEEYAIIADVASNFQSDYSSFAGTIIDSAWTTLNESGEPIAIKDSLGNIIESFTFISAPEHSLERADYNLVDYTSTNWREHASGNTAGSQNSNYGSPPPGPACGNSICEGGEDSLSCPADCPPPPAEVNVGDVAVNEFVSDPAEGNEWIELYNKKDFDINLSGWTLEDGVGTISTLSGTITASGAEKFKVIEISSSKLNNDGDIIKLKKSDGTIIDQITYGNWDDGNINNNAPAATDPNSVARKTDGQDTDNDLADFSVTTTLTKGVSNTISAPPPPPAQGGTPPPSAPSSPPSWPIGSLLINEFAADPTDGTNEWIELYNPTNSTINLNYWTIEDGSETVTTLSGSVLSLGFYVLEKPKGILNNTGDLIILKDPAGVVIDQVTYGDWDDGEKSDNAPTATDPNSVARKTDGQDTSNDFSDFATATPTKGASNAGGVAQNPSGAYSKNIVINEVSPNPKGDDSQNEFIELKNTDTVKIDLVGWKIGDNSSKTYTIKASDFSSTIVNPNGFFVLYRKTTGIALNNTGSEAAKLYAPDSTLIHSTEYSGAASEDNSYARENENYFWTTTPTPGKENIITRQNQPPTAAISAPEEGEIDETIFFDGSDSTDPDGDVLTFLWNFGDGATTNGASANHAFSAAGKFKVVLTVKDISGAMATAENYISITNPDAAENSSSDGGPLVFVNEILPNPEGSDDGEWVELWNSGTAELDLSDWKLDDDEGGSRPYKIPAGTIIGPNEFLIFKKETTKLAFNNTPDAARLLGPDGEVIFETSYDEVPEGASWARDERGNWQWTQTLTPGEKNIFKFHEKNTTKKSSAKTSANRTTKFIKTTLEDIREQDLGDGVKVNGYVTAPPNILGSQIFYIANEESCPGIQIYMYKKDFPELKIGDFVEVSGVLSEAGGERRVKVSGKENIKILKNEETPTPLGIKLSEVEESLEGCFITASGEVAEKSGSNLYFSDDDGELKIYFKSSLNFPKPKLDIGDQIEATGIISQTKTGFRLLPRYETDIKIKTPAPDKTALEVPANNRNNQTTGLLGAAAGVLGLTLVGLGVKMGTFTSWWKKIKGL